MVRKDEAYLRAQAAQVYRLLREAGPEGRSLTEIADDLYLPSIQPVVALIMWMRVRGVAIVCARSRAPGEPSRWTLASKLPESWDALL